MEYDSHVDIPYKQECSAALIPFALLAEMSYEAKVWRWSRRPKAEMYRQYSISALKYNASSHHSSK